VDRSVEGVGRRRGPSAVGAPVATVVHGTHDLGVHAKVKVTSGRRCGQKRLRSMAAPPGSLGAVGADG
jgi:hypothetical protein